MLDQNARVCDLIGSSIGIWKRGLIYQVFNKKESVIICYVPIRKANAVDKLIWWPSKDTKFSIKATKSFNRGESSSRIAKQHFGKAI